MKDDKYYDILLKKILTETLESKADELMEKIKNPDMTPGQSFDYVEEGETCETCGGEMSEGECMECGSKYRNEMSEDEMEEGNAFSGALEKAKEKGEKHFVVDGKKYPVKEENTSINENDEILYRLEYINESMLFTEDEIVDIIEDIIKEEEKNNIKKGLTPHGLTNYEKAHKGSGEENKKNIEMVSKKMKDYLKDGSKGKYEENPKHFPKGNGEIEKMEKKAFEISEDGQDFDYEIAGLQIPDYDEIHPNEEWVSDNLKGSSKTGNNQEWGNAVETPVNDKFDKFRKNQKLNKIKKKSYNRVSQPVFNEKPGTESGNGVSLKLESVEDKTQVKLNEEFNRIKNLMGYNQKTQ
jgi:hypothetical protein